MWSLDLVILPWSTRMRTFWHRYIGIFALHNLVFPKLWQDILLLSVTRLFWRIFKYKGRLSATEYKSILLSVNRGQYWECSIQSKCNNSSRGDTHTSMRLAPTPDTRGLSLFSSLSWSWSPPELNLILGNCHRQTPEYCRTHLEFREILTVFIFNSK